MVDAEKESVTMMECGCTIDYEKPGAMRDTIKYCPLHEAAPEMLAALKQFVKQTQRGVIFSALKGGTWEMAKKAIASAEPEKKKRDL